MNEEGKKRILWVGDAAVPSGFARCTHAACDALHEAGWDVHVLGINYHGDPHDYPYNIYPCYQPTGGGRDGFGVTRLPLMVNSLEPDVVVLLNDPWNIPAYLQSLKDVDESISQPLVIGWLAVDAKNQRGDVLNGLDHLVTWTNNGYDELKAGGYTGSHDVVPLGVDRGIYTPLNKMESRIQVCPPDWNDELRENAFIVGRVDRNQPRKRWDLTIEYFADWVKQYSVDNAYLYIHTAPTGERGFDLRSLVLYHEMAGRVILSEQDVSKGVPDSQMPYVYSAFDVFLTTTQGEGWGLGVLEAMACGVPCIVPDWTGLGEWTNGIAERITCTSIAPTAPMNSLLYTIGGIPDKDDTINSLQAYRNITACRLNDEIEQQLSGIKVYSWKRTGQEFLSIVDSIASR